MSPSQRHFHQQQMHEQAMRQQQQINEEDEWQRRVVFKEIAREIRKEKIKDFLVGTATIAVVGYGIYRLFK